MLDELSGGRVCLGIGSGIGQRIVRLGMRDRPLAALSLGMRMRCSDAADRRRPGAAGFDPAIRLSHWLTLFLVAGAFLLAVSIDLVPSRGEAAALVGLHRSFGGSVWVVTLARLVWRQFSQFPNWPADLPELMRFTAHWSEYALYALLLTQPILGLLHTNAHGDRVNLFFLGDLPAVIGRNRQLAKVLLEAHETVGLLLFGLIALHASAALYHHFWRRDDTLRAMLPLGRGRRASIR